MQLLIRPIFTPFLWAYQGTILRWLVLSCSRHNSANTVQHQFLPNLKNIERIKNINIKLLYTLFLEKKKKGIFKKSMKKNKDSSTEDLCDDSKYETIMFSALNIVYNYTHFITFNIHFYVGCTVRQRKQQYVGQLYSLCL